MDLKADIERIAIQERELELPRFDADVAWKLGLRLRELATLRRAAKSTETRIRFPPLSVPWPFTLTAIF